MNIQKKICIVFRANYQMFSLRSFRVMNTVKEFDLKGYNTSIRIIEVEQHTSFEKEHDVMIKDPGQLFFKPVHLLKFSMENEGKQFLYLKECGE